MFKHFFIQDVIFYIIDNQHISKRVLKKHIILFYIHIFYHYIHGLKYTCIKHRLIIFILNILYMPLLCLGLFPDSCLF
jgi:hypothetical protein